MQRATRGHHLQILPHPWASAPPPFPSPLLPMKLQQLSGTGRGSSWPSPFPLLLPGPLQWAELGRLGGAGAEEGSPSCAMKWWLQKLELWLACQPHTLPAWKGIRLPICCVAQVCSRGQEEETETLSGVCAVSDPCQSILPCAWAAGSWQVR